MIKLAILTPQSDFSDKTSSHITLRLNYNGLLLQYGLKKITKHTNRSKWLLYFLCWHTQKVWSVLAWSPWELRKKCNPISLLCKYLGWQCLSLVFKKVFWIALISASLHFMQPLVQLNREKGEPVLWQNMNAMKARFPCLLLLPLPCWVILHSWILYSVAFAQPFWWNTWERERESGSILEQCVCSDAMLWFSPQGWEYFWVCLSNVWTT